MVGASSSTCHCLSSHAWRSTYTNMHYSGEGGKQAETVEEHEGREPEEDEGRKKWKSGGW